MFNIYGGVVGIRKDQVKEIEDLLDEKEGAGKQEAPETTEKAEEEEKLKNQGESEKGEEVSGRDSKKQTFLKEKRRIIEEIDRVSLAFKAAKTQNDKKQKDEYWKEFLLLQRQLSKLRNQVMAENEGKLPLWWDSVR